jgi:hypothetical protein
MQPRLKTPKIQKRSKGQTVVFETWEWCYTPTELRPATWRQLEEESRKGANIRVIQWPQGLDVFRNGEYLSLSDEELARKEPR